MFVVVCIYDTYTAFYVKCIVLLIFSITNFTCLTPVMVYWLLSLVFYLLQKLASTGVTYFFKYLSYIFQDLTLSGLPSLKFCTAVLLVLLIVEN
jgi:ABC-type polysaccharide/polyol phosphate export permease